MSCVSYGATVQPPYVPCIVSIDDIKSLEHGVPHRLQKHWACQDGGFILRTARQRPKNEHGKERYLSEQVDCISYYLSLANLKSFLKVGALCTESKDLAMPCLFKFEPLHNLHFGVSKIMTECMIVYLLRNSL